jgi:hypothetical protein
MQVEEARSGPKDRYTTTSIDENRITVGIVVNKDEWQLRLLREIGKGDQCIARS